MAYLNSKVCVSNSTGGDDRDGGINFCFLWLVVDWVQESYGNCDENRGGDVAIWHDGQACRVKWSGNLDK